MRQPHLRIVDRSTPVQEKNMCGTSRIVASAGRNTLVLALACIFAVATAGIAASPAHAAIIEYSSFGPLDLQATAPLTVDGVTATFTALGTAGDLRSPNGSYFGTTGGHSSMFDGQPEEGGGWKYHEGVSVSFSGAGTLTQIDFLDLAADAQFTLAIGDGSTQTFAGSDTVAGVFDVAANYTDSNALASGQEFILYAVGTTTDGRSQFRVAGITADVVPEPATAGLLGLGALLTFGRRARRR